MEDSYYVIWLNLWQKNLNGYSQTIPSLTVMVILEYPTLAGVILIFLDALLPVIIIFAFGTTAVLLLDVVTVRFATGVTSSLIVKSMPKMVAGSVGSLITPLIPKEPTGAVVIPPSS